MLRYEVRQLHLEDVGRFYLPLPKFTDEQLASLTLDLQLRGFKVSRKESLRVSGHGTRSTVGLNGLATSSDDMLDSVVPSVARLLGLPSSMSESNPYFAAKRKARHTEVQFFPRME